VSRDSVLRGTLAASVTPLLPGGARLDEDGFALLVDMYVVSGLDGLLAFGTNGEGVLFSVEERRRGARLFVEAAAGRLDVAVQCGAQTTADTVALAADAAEAGAAAVAVIGPPYFPLDEQAQLSHFAAAAHACAPLPFYVYEFARTSGYAVTPEALRRLREVAPNLTGLKVSDTPWGAFEPYLVLDLDVLVGPEALIDRGMQAGAVGAVSALASAFPEEVAAVVSSPSAGGAASLAALRGAVERFPRHAAMKRILAARGLAIHPDVRAPLRDLDGDEERELDAWLASMKGSTVLAHGTGAGVDAPDAR
jgi:dihydrodipicolinate synthase/N-acetylneuraminate lyase